jgi:hypothetical protein
MTDLVKTRVTCGMISCEAVGFAIWDSTLTIGNLSFRGVIARAAEASVSKEPGSAE